MNKTVRPFLNKKYLKSYERVIKENNVTYILHIYYYIIIIYHIYYIYILIMHMH